MLSNLSFQGLVALTCLGVANAHMRLASPIPFNVESSDNSPITGATYPCKAPNQPSAYSMTAINKIPVNEPVLLGFKGSAIHGGGTCQLSITMDKEPTPDSVFKVIQTYYGDCPVTTGNGLTFNIPKDFPNCEQCTLAWSWFNRIGNREMYMDCAPIQVTGGSSNKDYFNSLPDMMKANIGDGITTEDNKDPVIPNPGAFVIKSSDFVEGKFVGASASANPPGNDTVSSGDVKNFASFSAPATDSNQVIPVNGGSGSSAGGSGAAPTSSAGNDGQYTQPAATSAQSSTVATSSAAPTSAAPSVGGSSSFQTFTIPASSADTPAYPTLLPTDGQGATGPSTGAASPTSSTSSGGTAGTCTTDGAIVCNGASQFGLCDHGKVVWQAVAAGTTCSNGSIQKKRSISVHRAAHGVHRRRGL